MNDNYLYQEKIVKNKIIKKLKEKEKYEKIELIKCAFNDRKVHYKDGISIKEFKYLLKEELPEKVYENELGIVQSIDDQVSYTIKGLECGSINAFSKLMNFKYSNYIAKRLNIKLDGKLLLVSMPTTITNAIKKSDLRHYYISNEIKQKKSKGEMIISKELDNILLNLEISSSNKLVTDTRFSNDIQKIILEFLKINTVSYQYTGYKSLISMIYNLDDDEKLLLIKIILKYKNINYYDNKILMLENKIKSIDLIKENVKNSIIKNSNLIQRYSLFGTWISGIYNTKWMIDLVDGLSLICRDTPKLLGKCYILKNKNNTIFVNSIGFEFGVATRSILSIIATVKDMINNKNATIKYRKIDNKLYYKDDRLEYSIIMKRLNNETSLEYIIIDILFGVLYDNNIKLDSIPSNILEFRKIIMNMNDNDREFSLKVLNNINNILNSTNEYSKILKKIKMISGTLILSGFSSLSIYDIIKSEKFIPELSMKIYNNL